LGVFIAEHWELLEGLNPEQQLAWFLPFLLRAGWEPDIAAMRASTYARLFVLSWAEALKKANDPGRRRAVARRLLALAAGIGKVLKLKHRDALKENAALVAKEIRALHIDWPDAARAAAVFDQVAQGSCNEFPRSEIVAALDRVNQLAENYSAIAELVATPERR